MIIATWNVNSIRTRLPHLEKWVRDRNPDIILLQELKCLEEAFPHEPISDLGYNVAVLGQKSYNGVAILSKDPLEDIVYGLPTFPQDESARYIEAQVGTIRVASVYVPNGQEVGTDKFAYKMDFLKAFQEHITHRLRDEEPFIIGGDYNIAPLTCDVHDPSLMDQERIHFSTPEREAFRRLENCGLVDGFRTLYPALMPGNQTLFSWWDYRAGSYAANKGYRIDHLLCSPQAADLIQAAGIDHDTRGETQPSDHAPVWLDLI